MYNGVSYTRRLVTRKPLFQPRVSAVKEDKIASHTGGSYTVVYYNAHFGWYRKHASCFREHRYTKHRYTKQAFGCFI